MAAWTLPLIFAFIPLVCYGQPMSEDGPCQGQLPSPCTCSNTTINCSNAPSLKLEQLKEIPLWFPRLIALHLCNNNFTYLPEDLFNLKSPKAVWHLQQLDFSNSSIIDIHADAFVKLPSLQHLKLVDNRISYVKRPVAPGQRVWATGNFLYPVSGSLQILNLSNAFDEGERRKSSQYITRKIFTDENRFGSLVYLDLSNNDIDRIPTDTFGQCPSLEYLYLYNNHLSAFRMDPDAARGLKELYLKSNYFQTLDQSFVDTLTQRPQLTNVSLANNRFVCDCRMKSFIKWLKLNPMVKDRSELYCYKMYPRHAKNENLLLVDEDQLQCRGDGKTVYATGVFVMCAIAALALISLLTCVVYANKRLLFNASRNVRNWLHMSNSGGYEILESERRVKAEAV